MSTARQRAADAAWQFVASAAVTVFETTQRRRVNRRGATITVGSN